MYPQLFTPTRRTTTLRRRTIGSLFFCAISLMMCWQNANVTAQLEDVVQTNVVVAKPKVQWRRTSVGWEPTDAWESRGPQLGPPPPAARVHPAVIAAMQALLSIGALVLFEYTDEDESADLVHMLTESTK